MKILFAVQGTGNGHISRAKEIVPYLRQYGELDILVSGTQVDVQLEHPVKYNKTGVSFIFGKTGGVNYWQTVKRSNIGAFYHDIKHFPIEQYDLVINDFEPIVALACKRKGLPSVGLSHQSSLLSVKSPRPAKGDFVGELVIRKYAPATQYIGFHFQKYDDYINTPVIRSAIRGLEATNNGHYTVYLPAYSDHLLVGLLKQVHVRWEVFSKHTKRSYIDGNVSVMPITDESYVQSMASCEGLLTGGGFESPAEALFLNKKVMAVPMFGQYEQQCNAEALRQMEVPVVKKLDQQAVQAIKDWVNSPFNVKVNYSDETESIVQNIVKEHIR